MGDSPRAQRVGDEVRNALARAILIEASDDRLRGVCMTEVRMSPDLSHARVYWNVIKPEPPTEREMKALERALQRASGFLRNAVRDAVHLRVVPSLAFVYDESIERGRAMDQLLGSLDIPSTDDEAEES
ncbi:MAG: ribosome-binding factor A [Bradymonadia bacterium]